jgi:phage gp45-like
MGAVKLFRGVINSIAEGTSKGLRVAQLTVRGSRALADVPMMQQKGFASLPAAGDAVTVMEVNDLDQVIASDSTNRPALADGDTIVYADANTFVRLNSDKTVTVQSGTTSKITMAPDGTITIHGTKVIVQGDTLVNVLAPVVGLGEDATVPNPLDGVMTPSCSQCLLLAVPHIGGSAHVFAKGLG